MVSLLVILMVAVYLYMVGWHRNWGYMFFTPAGVLLFAARAWAWDTQPLDNVEYLMNLLGFGAFFYGALIGTLEGTKRACRDLDRYLVRRLTDG